MYTITRKEVKLQIVDDGRSKYPVKHIVDTVMDFQSTILYVALEESTRLNASCPGNVAYVVTEVDVLTTS